MDHTFITIHNLTSDANILFVSDSVTDILGYQPQEVQGRPCFDFFHPDEVEFARSIHSRGVLLDKAAVLHYARVLSRNGRWVNCECCFTIVHDVLVACTSIYRQTPKSERRALEAPQIRRLFSCSPRDPRYHMLEHLSPKFRMPPTEREPRAALILNRFTRSLSIIFSTNAVANILGLEPDDLSQQSFYDCIQESCLEDAIRCLEGAKANDSIAYLRFWSRDPRQPEDLEYDESICDTEDRYDGVSRAGTEASEATSVKSEVSQSPLTQRGIRSRRETPPFNVRMDAGHESLHSNNVQSDEDSRMEDGGASLKRSSSEYLNQRMSELPPAPPSVKEERSHTPESKPFSQRPTYPIPSMELEAVVSCTSDGLVVVLRKARPANPSIRPPQPPAIDNGLFAAPWALNPIRPRDQRREPADVPVGPDPQSAHAHASFGGPPLENFMRSIRDVAVFAWALVGINENLAAYAQGLPRAEAMPPHGHQARLERNRGHLPHHEFESVAYKAPSDWDMSIRDHELAYPAWNMSASHRGRSMDDSCSCQQCRSPEWNLQYDAPSQRCEPDRNAPGPSARRGLRSHASTSSLPMPETLWPSHREFAIHRGGHRWTSLSRNQGGNFPYPTL